MNRGAPRKAEREVGELVRVDTDARTRVDGDRERVGQGAKRRNVVELAQQRERLAGDLGCEETKHFGFAVPIEPSFALTA